MPGAYNEVKTKLSKVWKKNKLVTLHTKEQTNTIYQPGGTATLLTIKAIFRAHDSGKDKWGRWSHITLRGQNGRKVTFVSAYQVCDNNLSTAGLNTAWMQQWCAMKREGFDNPNPQKQFLTDLGTFIK
eukprot:1181888-Ditylum_brightwellii.AAC.1